MLPAGGASNGYKALNFSPIKDYPVLEEIKAMGDLTGDGSNVGSVIYNRGMLAAMLTSEAIAKAQEIHGVSEISAPQLRDGLEALSVTEARLVELGMGGISPEFSVSCQNHGGAGQAIVQQWDADAKVWKALTDYISSDQDVIAPLVKSDSEAYAAENKIEAGC